ncbi:MAG TPA: hypothetical protein VKG02_17920, partial [Blastocatellia bacterium]|nr:hypothetical protein [Blastocatellia bacterium]
TYSTLYIASPFMLWWEGRKAGRRPAAMAAASNPTAPRGATTRTADSQVARAKMRSSGEAGGRPRA